jgi:hypothetical protein
MPFLNQAGYGLLAFDCREHGFSTSSKRGISWHSREAADVVVACDYAKVLSFLTHLFTPSLACALTPIRRRGK